MPEPMINVPITPGLLTGDILEAYHRGYLQSAELSAWAEALIIAGYDSDAVTEALGNPDMHWQEMPRVFSDICHEVGLSSDPETEIESLKQQVMIEEYRHGHRQGAELFQRFDELRKRAGFPEPVHLRLMEDNADGSNDSGYYSDSKQHGPELESLVGKALQKLGIEKRIERFGNENPPAKEDQTR